MKAICYRGNDIPEEPVSKLTGDSFLASAAFASVWQSRRGRRVVWTVEDAGQVIGVFPGIEFGRWPVRRFMGMPNGLYGRLFVAEGAERKAASVCVLQAITQAGYVKAFVFDFYGDFTGDTAPYAVTADSALLVNIGAAEWEPPDRKLRGEIRKAEREGLTVERMNWAKHGEGFTGLLRTTARAHGGEARYAPAFWKRLADAAGRDNRVIWYFATLANQPVSSHIYFVEGDMLIGWQMYYNREFASLKANPHLIFRACEEARARGVRTLDLGATPSGAEGTEFFKRRWGGCEHMYRTLTLRRGIGRWL